MGVGSFSGRSPHPKKSEWKLIRRSQKKTTATSRHRLTKQYNNKKTVAAPGHRLRTSLKQIKKNDCGTGASGHGGICFRTILKSEKERTKIDLAKHDSDTPLDCDADDDGQDHDMMGEDADMAVANDYDVARCRR